MSFTHRYSIVVALGALIIIITGAALTSTSTAHRQIEVSAPVPNGRSWHTVPGIVLSALSLGLAIAIWRGGASRWMFSFAGIAFTTLAVLASSGFPTHPSPGLAILHATAAPVFLALVGAIALAASPLWQMLPDPVDGSSKPFLRPLGMVLPFAVLLQVIFGAAYRHDLTSVMPHMGWAAPVVFLALFVATVILQDFPRPASLRRAAAMLITAVLLQVCLGIGAFVMLVSDATETPYFVVATVGHVTVGALTLTASVVTAMEVWRHVSPKHEG
jgi:hypothetical protein